MSIEARPGHITGGDIHFFIYQAEYKVFAPHSKCSRLTKVEKRLLPLLLFTFLSFSGLPLIEVGRFGRRRNARGGIRAPGVGSRTTTLIPANIPTGLAGHHDIRLRSSRKGRECIRG